MAFSVEDLLGEIEAEGGVAVAGTAGGGRRSSRSPASPAPGAPEQPSLFNLDELVGEIQREGPPAPTGAPPTATPPAVEVPTTRPRPGTSLFQTWMRRVGLGDTEQAPSPTPAPPPGGIDILSQTPPLTVAGGAFGGAQGAVTGTVAGSFGRPAPARRELSEAEKQALASEAQAPTPPEGAAAAAATSRAIAQTPELESLGRMIQQDAAALTAERARLETEGQALEAIRAKGPSGLSPQDRQAATERFRAHAEASQLFNQRVEAHRQQIEAYTTAAGLPEAEAFRALGPEAQVRALVRGTLRRTPAEIAAQPPEVPLAGKAALPRFGEPAGSVEDTLAERAARTASAVNRALDRSMFAQPVSAVGTVLKAAGSLVPGIAGGPRIQRFGQAIVDEMQALQEPGGRLEPTVRETASLWNDPTLLIDPEWLLPNVAMGAGSTVPSLAVAAGAGPVMVKLGARVAPYSPRLAGFLAEQGAMYLGGAVGGLQEGVSTYEEVKKRGGSDMQALAGMTMMTLASGYLNAISNMSILERRIEAGRLAARFVKSGAVEAGTEYLEEPAEAVIKGLLGVNTWPEAVEQLKQGVNVIPGSFLSGGGASVSSAVAQGAPATRPAPGRAPVAPPVQPPAAAGPSPVPTETRRTVGPPMAVAPGPIVQQAEATLGPGASPDAIEAEVNRLMGIPEEAAAQAPPLGEPQVPQVEAPVPQVQAPEAQVQAPEAQVPPAPLSQRPTEEEDLGYPLGQPTLQAERPTPAEEPPAAGPTVAEVALGPQAAPPPVPPVIQPRRPAPGRRQPAAPTAVVRGTAPEPSEQAATYGTTLDLTDPDSIAAFVKAHGGVKTDPTRKGEMRLIPVGLRNNRTGQNWDVIAQQGGVEPQAFLDALTNLDTMRRQKRERLRAEQRALETQAQLDALPVEDKAAREAALTGRQVEEVAAELRADLVADEALKDAVDFFDTMERQREAEAHGQPSESDLSAPAERAPTGAAVPGPGEGPAPAGEAGGRGAERPLPLGPPAAPGGPPAAARPEAGPRRRAPGRRTTTDATDALARASTDQPFQATLYQGRGARPTQVYALDVLAAGGGPILGRANYYALSERDAARYGDEVTERAVSIERPVVLDSNTAWVDLLRAADAPHLDTTGRARFEDPAGLPAASQRVQDYLRAQGYDGVIVRIPDRADVNDRGQSIKRLREAFGHSQVIAFERAVPTARTAPARDQARIPGTEASAVPPTPTRATTPQAELTETPLFGQERAARERKREVAQQEIPAAPGTAAEAEPGTASIPNEPAKAGDEFAPGPAYPHARRLRTMVDVFGQQIASAEGLPKDGRALRKLVAKATGITEDTLGRDPTAVDDLFDGLEAAVNLRYKANREAGQSLDQQLDRAVKTEAWMVNRLKTIEVRERQQFSTPLPLAEGAAYALDVRPGETVGEPTAGTGTLLAPLPPEVAVQAVELDPRRVETLRVQGYHIEQGDALQTPLEASVVVMNPPWGKYTTKKYGHAIPMPYGGAVDLAERFVVKVLRELPAGGRVSAVMPTTILQSPGFLKWLQTEHTLRALIQSPPGAYNSRGTTVDSVLLVVDKGVTPDAPTPIRAAPSSWQDYAEALRPLAAGGTHARAIEGPVQPATAGPAARHAVEPRGPARRGRAGTVPDLGSAPGAEGQPAGVGEPAQAAAEPAAVAEAAPADAADRGPGDGGPAAGVSPVERGRGAPGRGEPGAGVVPGPGRGRVAAEPAGPGGGVRESTGGAAAYPARQAGQRFSVASRADLDAAERSDVFAAAPLRSAPGSNPHPRLIVRTRSLAGAQLPEVTYRPSGQMLADAYSRKMISDAQWDSGIIPALQAAHRGHGFLYAADVGVGKALPADAPVLTPTGWTTMGALHIGDLVIGADGAATPILGVYPQGPRQMFRVRFSDGAEVECDAEHLWLTRTRYERQDERYPDRARGQVRTTAEISATLRDGREYRHSIPLVAPVKFESRPVTLDSYLLGVLLGDACLRHSSVTLTSADQWLLDRVGRSLPSGIILRRLNGRRYEHGIVGPRGRGNTHNSVVTALRSYGLLGLRSWEKHVPKDYLFNDAQVRLGLLRGLMDTDGTVAVRGACPVFSTTSRQLALDVQFLARSLGATASIADHHTAGRPAFRVTMACPREINPFLLPRKAARVASAVRPAPRRSIRAIAVGRVADAVCIRVAAADGLFIVDGFVVTHNTRVAAAVAGEWLETGDAKRLLYVTAGEVNVQDVKKEFDLYAGGTWPWEIIEVATLKDSSERGKRDTVQPLPKRDQAIYLIDRYNLAAYRRALEDVGLDGVIGDEAHLYKNIDNAALGEAWILLQKQIMARNGKFLYLTATPASSVDDLEHFIGLKEWAPDGFGDWMLRVTGQAPEARATTNQLREMFNAAQTQYLALTGKTEEAQQVLESYRRTIAESEDLRTAYQQAIDGLRQEVERVGAQGVTDVGSDAEAVTGRKKKKGFFSGTDAFAVHITPAEQEQIMRELATKGKYDSVDLWRAGVEFEIQTNPLSPTQAQEYGQIADFFRRLNDAFMQFGRLNKTKKMFTIRHFLQQEAKRRMFDYRLGPAIEAAKAALARGEQVVISTISVNPTDETSGPIPAAINSINTRAVEVDSESREVISDEEIPEALVRRAELLEEWIRLRQMGDPIEQIVSAFGKNDVAVITGAQSAKIREKVIKEFQQGERRVAIISGAGKTGISLHHILKAGKGAQGRRHLIVTDYEWSATTFKQELGRVDRSGQVSAPKVTVLSTGAAGERKFLATIANRMRNLGALSKGSAESASNENLAEFEIGGSLDTYAMRLAYNSLSPEIQDLFIARNFRDPNDRQGRNLRGLPQAASLKDFLLDLQFMPPEAANTAFDAFWRSRQELVEQAQAKGEEKAERTRAYRGEILRSTELAPNLTLREVKDESGQRFGILQGLVTDHMTRIVRFLPTQGYSETPIRRYVSFRAGDEQVSGLEVRHGAIRGLAQSFGQEMGQDIRTPEQALEALKAGDKVPLEGQAGYVLRMRPSDQRIVIEGARMADRDLLQRHGAAYSPAGNLWMVPEDKLGAFLERFPVKQATPKAQPPGREPEPGPTFGLFMGIPGATTPRLTRPNVWTPTAGTGLAEIEAMNRPEAPQRGIRERLRSARQRVIETQVNKFEPLRPLMDLVESLQGPTRTGLPLGQVASERLRRGGAVPIEVAELAKSRTNGQIQSFAIRFGRVYRAAYDGGLETALNAYLTLRQMDKRIRDLAARPWQHIPGQLPGAPMGGVSALTGERTIQGALTGKLVNPRGFDTPKIHRELARLEQELGPERWQAVEQYAEDLWRLNREILDKSHAAGIVSDDAYEAIVGRGDDYVPFHVLDYINAHEPQGGATKPYSVRYQDYLRRMEGTERDVANVVEASLEKGVRAIALINRNRAAHAVTRLAPLLPGVIDQVPGDTFTLPEDREVVSAFVNGERQNYAVPPEVHRALTFLDEKELGYIERFLGLGATPLRAGATGANLAFMLTNAARDWKAAAIYSKYGIKNPIDFFRFPIDWVRAMASVYRQDAAYLQFLESGAAFTTFQKALTPEGFLQRSARVAPARRDIETGQYGKAAVLAPGRMLRFIFEGAQRINNIVEETTKLATFQRGLREGDQVPQVAYETANYGGSPNFARSGSLARELNLVWMFYNARLQGTARTIRRFTESPSVAAKATALRLGLLVGLPVTLLWLWNQQWDDDHGLEEISPTDRQRYHIILLPETYQAADGTTKRQYLKIAKEEGEQLLAPLIENGLTWLKGREPQGLAELAADFAGNLSPVTFEVQEQTPTGVARAVGSGALAGMNPLLRIPTELTANYNARTQGAIVPRGLADNVLPAEQVRPTTSPTMIQVAALLGVSPIKLEYAVTSATGGVGQGVLDVVDRAQGKDLPETMTAYERAARQPFIARFLGTSGDAQDRKTEEELYRTADEAQRTRGSMKAVTKTGNEDRLETLTEDRAVVLQGMAGRLQALTRGLAEVRQLQVWTTHHLEADVETKREILAVLADRRHAILESFRMLKEGTDDFTLAGGGEPLAEPEVATTP